MRRKPSTVILAALMLVATASACKFNFSTANITDATMAKDVNDKKEAVNPTTTFETTDSIIHAVVELGNAPNDTRVKAVWTAVKVEGQKPNQLMDETELTTDGKNLIDFTFSPSSGGLPPGDYKVDIYLNPEAENAEKAPEKTLTFSVRAADGGKASTDASATKGSIPAVTESFISLEDDGAAVDTVPSEADMIYCQVKFNGPASGLKVTAHWIAVNVSGIEPNSELVSTPYNLQGAEDIVKFNISNPGNGFPLGSYRVDIFVNDSASVTRSVAFTVE